MRFNEKRAEYGTGAGPLQTVLLEKKFVLSNEAIEIRKKDYSYLKEKFKYFKYNCPITPTLQSINL